MHELFGTFNWLLNLRMSRLSLHELFGSFNWPLILRMSRLYMQELFGSFNWPLNLRMSRLSLHELFGSFNWPLNLRMTRLYMQELFGSFNWPLILRMSRLSTHELFVNSELVVVISFNSHAATFASWHILTCHNVLRLLRNNHNTQFRFVSVSQIPQRVAVFFALNQRFRFLSLTHTPTRTYICSHITTELTKHRCILADYFNNCNFSKHE